MIRKETIMRLLKDVKEITKNPLTSNGIYYVHDETDMLKGYALIIGPPDTPYFGGYYFFDIKYPSDYPYSLPSVKYSTNGNNVRFHPNLYTDGKVCISILGTWRGEQWSSCQNISSLLLSLFMLFTSNPLLNEPGVKSDNIDIKIYNKIIEYSNIRTAVCDIITKKQGVYLDFFDLFESIIKEHFLKNVDQLILFSESKIPSESSESLHLNRFYNSMRITTDYKTIINDLNKIKNTL
jgi:ubiquitin-conjugating enzyme E2 Z